METPDTKPCPVCGETIKSAAIKCRFCNTDLEAFTRSREQQTEQLLFEGHPAALYSAGQFLPFAILVILGGVLAAQMDTTQNMLYVLLAATLACLITWLYFWLKTRGTWYTITTQRITVRKGVLSQKQETLEIFRIDHFELLKPFLWRLMGHASLRLFSSDAELEQFSIYALPHLEALANTLRECQLRERARRGLTTFVKA